jgi:hypothetical protein
MYEFINFADFYHRPLIPIGENDFLSIPKEPSTSSCEDSTHWLIGLVGSEKDKSSAMYQWNVVVFASDTFGCVNYKTPYFVSPFINSFNEAFEFSKQLENMAFQDQLISINN